MALEIPDASKLGFGCMRLPQNDPKDVTDIDIEHFKQMVDAYIEGGGNYFDTAFVYHNGHSEVALRQALVECYPRESFTIATKCLAWALPDAEAAKACLDTSLERLGTDYVDYYLLHNVGGDRTKKFDDFGLWEWAQEQKAAGKIRHVGFSMHDGPETLKALLTAHPEVDFIQLQVNYLDWENPVVQSRRNMEVAQKFGVPVIIMEPCRGGRLADLPAKVAAPLTAARPDLSQASWAYRFCYNQPGVMTVLAGMSTLDQVKQNVAEWKANGSGFSDAEQAALAEANGVLAAMPTVPCTNCRYCVKDCPQQVAIPEIMSLLNLELQTENREFAKQQYSWQAVPGKASDCIQCGACESMCPQSIDIIDQLEKAADHFE
jgi:uncharacterized protein